MTSSSFSPFTEQLRPLHFTTHHLPHKQRLFSRLHNQYHTSIENGLERPHLRLQDRAHRSLLRRRRCAARARAAPANHELLVPQQAELSCSTITTSSQASRRCGFLPGYLHEHTGHKQVCGSDGKVYLNECFFQNGQCRKVHKNLTRVAWDGTNCPTTCTTGKPCNEIDKFTCGSDGNVYRGFCSLFVAQCVDLALEALTCPAGTIVLPPYQ